MLSRARGTLKKTMLKVTKQTDNAPNMSRLRIIPIHIVRPDFPQGNAPFSARTEVGGPEVDVVDLHEITPATSRDWLKIASAL